ncbi:kinase-like protein [Rhizopogon vinicolor AM-OR11-026]|uniref:Kinase-like protein n=1 Tax=Rhizopogon vinicolor AM-OR11-026 TaxID=1314800 RepID=A0A1B7MGR0_9AGAM|nr:kinase-like protein [Rhizopogon vinicolor AM-OR11-026]
MHENILSLLGVAEGDYATGCHALVCPWMENGTLERYLKAYPRMVLRQKLHLLRDVTAGLRYLHSQAVRHGDLTNYNVLVDVNGRAVVADFGLSYQLSDLHGSSYSLTAAARWMAPELTDGHGPPTTRSDMYSFGSIMNYVLSRERPFDRHQDNMHVFSALHNKEAPFTSRGKDVSGEHWKFIQRCLSNSTPSRPSAEDAYKFLQRELDSTK